LSVRIYALAREQNIPSKDVVDLCAQLGIDLKSHSPMATITEDEAQRVVHAIKNRSVRHAGVGAGGASGLQPVAPSIRREDYIPASGVSAKIRDLDKPAEKLVKPPEDDKKGTAAAVKGKARPLPKVGAAPTPVLRPTAPKAEPAAPPEEPKVQKPLMPLSPVALRGALKERPAPPAPAAAEARPAAKPTPPVAAPPPLPKRPAEKRPVKGKPAPVEEEEERPAHPHRPGAVPGREERQRKRGRRAAERRVTHEDEDLTRVLTEEEAPPAPARPPRVRRRGGVAVPAATAVARPARIAVAAPLTVRTLSQTTGIRAQDMLRKLMDRNILATINSTLDEDTANLLAIELGIELEIKRAPDVEEQLMAARAEDQPDMLELRPPVVTFLGHVDHGKTSLLDALRKSNVVASESGGITQHIGAYQVEHNGRRVTFLDTPGHEAFTAMRSRGAHVTDVVVLVVAADDGVMPQTEEAISHARAAGVPIIVAINKVDLPNSNVHRVMQQLSNLQLLPAEWGGDTEFVQTSASTGRGLDDLLETLVAVAELRELKANPGRLAGGTCLEASLHETRGVLATFLVQEGTLQRGDLVLCGQAYGRVKAMFDDRERPIREAGPSAPVVISGLDVVPAAGDHFIVLDDLEQAREVAERRRLRQRTETLAQRRHVTLETLMSRMTEEKVKELRLILRADVRGSIEAIAKELEKLQHPEVAVRVLHAAVGAITESDVLLADASDAVIVGFNVVPDEGARTVAEDKGVEIRRYEIIYQLTDDIRKSLEGMLKPELREVELGRALVQQVFKLSRVGTVAGCRVLQGVVERVGKVRLIRDGRVIYPEPGSGKEANIQSLKRLKDDVREVREGFECGIKVAGYDDIKEGDIIEVYKIQETQRTL
jgi:translation initiation factor IF-2